MARSPFIATRIPQQLRDDLDAAIISLGKSESEIVNEALIAYLGSEAKPLVRGRPKQSPRITTAAKKRGE